MELMGAAHGAAASISCEKICALDAGDQLTQSPSGRGKHTAVGWGTVVESLLQRTSGLSVR